jgi:hypothetical protein
MIMIKQKKNNDKKPVASPYFIHFCDDEEPVCCECGMILVSEEGEMCDECLAATEKG